MHSVGIVLGSFWHRFGIVLGSCCHCFGIILGSFWDRFGGTGSSAAAPIAKKVIKKVLERHSLRQSINNLPGDPI